MCVRGWFSSVKFFLIPSVYQALEVTAVTRNVGSWPIWRLQLSLKADLGQEDNFRQPYIEYKKSHWLFLERKGRGRDTSLRRGSRRMLF